MKTYNLKANQSLMSKQSLPDIPEKRYFTISEVSELCALKPHVLRYWEQEFTQLKPAKRRGNRRYYQEKDILLVRQIRELLYEKGYTIAGAKHQLTQLQRSLVLPANPTTPSLSSTSDQSNISTIIVELQKLLEVLTK